MKSIITKNIFIFAAAVVFWAIGAFGASASTVTRSFSTAAPAAGTTLTVSLAVNVAAPDTIYIIDEIVPTGWAVLDPGTGDTTQAGHIKWAVISGAVSTVYNYTVNIPADALGPYSFSGEYGFDSMSVPMSILGETSVSVIIDTTSPVITLLGTDPMDVLQNSVFIDPGATAMDDVDGDITASIAATGVVDTATLGTYILTYDVADSSGNAATSVTRTVNVIVDTIAPVITLNGSDPVNVEFGSPYIEPGATWNDNIDGTGNAIVGGDIVNVNVLGMYIVTYNYTDTSGNAAIQVTRTVNVMDTTVPIITLLGATPTDVSQNSVYTDAGATAMDNFDGDITAGIVISGNVNTAILGTYTVTYNVTDFNGNAAATVTRTVNVVADTTSPVITLLGADPMNVLQNSVFIDPGATAMDDVDGDITASIAATGIVDTATLGTYILTYNVTDAAGNMATPVTRTVNVIVDTIAPVITLLGPDPDIANANSVYVDPGATVMDDVDGDITASITATAINTAILGPQVITYTVSDSSGNIATATRTVNVVDIIPPIITILGDNPAYVLLNGVYTDAGATAVDNADGNITAQIIMNSTVDAATTGIYTVDYTVSDSSGNTAMATRTVQVVTNLPPIVTPIPNMLALINIPFSFTATATDPETDPITFSLGLDAPVGASIDPVTGLFNWIPDTAGVYAFNVLAADGITEVMSPASITVTEELSAAPLPGIYFNIIDVTLSAPGSSSIIYTLDGTDPSCPIAPDFFDASAVGTVYMSPIHLMESATVKAIACHNDLSSPISSFEYQINIGISPDDFLEMILEGIFEEELGFTPTSTPSITITQPIDINIADDDAGMSKISIAKGTVITRTDGGLFDAAALEAMDEVEDLIEGVDDDDFEVDGVIRWGLPGIELSFNPAINVSVFVGVHHNGQSLSIVRSTDGVTWTSEGISPASCVVADGFCEFTATRASQYATYHNTTPAPTPAPAPSGGGGGGGSGFVDIIPPANPSILINEGDLETLSNTVNLSLRVSGGDFMIVSNTPNFEGKPWENFEQEISWTLPAGLGEKTVYAKFKDMAGNETAVVSDSIEVSAGLPEESEQQVLGVKLYADGTLLRVNKRTIFIVIGDKVKKIKNLEELRQYAGRSINDVQESVLDQYEEISDSQLPASAAYSDGTLLRDQNKRIYVIKGGKKYYIPNMAELRKYAGKKITDVAAGVLEGYETGSASSSSSVAIANGMLIRGSDMKIYIIINGKKQHIKTLSELRQYAGREIHNVNDSEIGKY